MGLNTTLVVTTNRRTYSIRLKSVRGSYMDRVGFEYPADKPVAAARGGGPVGRPAALSDLYDDRYVVAGNAAFRPVRVYNDGIRTVLEMPLYMRSREAPVLHVIDRAGQPQIVNYRLQDDRYIVDQVFDRAVLSSGVGWTQEKVTIHRGELDPVAAFFTHLQLSLPPECPWAVPIGTAADTRLTMSATPNPTLSHPATAPQRAAAQKAPVRRMNRVPLFIAAGTMGLITVVGIAVAIDRAHRRTAEPPKMADPSSSEALARRLTAGRPDDHYTKGTRDPRPTPRSRRQPRHRPAAPSRRSRQTAAAPQGDTMEEVRKRLALQRYERLEQEKQRQELAVIQGHDEALSSPTLVDMARGSYARMADRVRNGQVPGGPLVRSGVVASSPRGSAWCRRCGARRGLGRCQDRMGERQWGQLPIELLAIGHECMGQHRREITPVPGGGYTGGGSGGTGFNGGGFGTGVGGLPPGTLTALQQAQIAPDPNGQSGKLGFLNQQTDAQGYLAHVVQQPLSPYELKKGSVIPATMITGVNSDLPGRMIAQVNQNVYDSATGRYLLIPQGSRLFGRYDANVTYGQERVLVVWTDLTFPDGSTLHLGAMAGHRPGRLRRLRRSRRQSRAAHLRLGAPHQPRGRGERVRRRDRPQPRRRQRLAHLRPSRRGQRVLDLRQRGASDAPEEPQRPAHHRGAAGLPLQRDGRERHRVPALRAMMRTVG